MKINTTKILSLALALCMILILASCADTPSTPSPSNVPETANTAAYREHLGELLETLTSSDTFVDYMRSYYRGALADLNNDGVEEMIIIYRVVEAIDAWNSKEEYHYEIHTTASGNRVLLKTDLLFVDAGGPSGGVNLVTFGSDTYIAVWHDNLSGGDNWRLTYTCELYTLTGGRLTLDRTYDFSVLLENTEGIHPMEQDAEVLLDGKPMTYSDFLAAFEILQNPTRVICMTGAKEPVGTELWDFYEVLK